MCVCGERALSPPLRPSPQAPPSAAQRPSLAPRPRAQRPNLAPRPRPQLPSLTPRPPGRRGGGVGERGRGLALGPGWKRRGARRRDPSLPGSAAVAGAAAAAAGPYGSREVAESGGGGERRQRVSARAAMRLRHRPASPLPPPAGHR